MAGIRGRPRKAQYSLQELLGKITDTRFDKIKKKKQDVLLGDLKYYLDKTPEEVWPEVHRLCEKRDEQYTDGEVYNYDEVKDWQAKRTGGQREPSYWSLPARVFETITEHDIQWLEQPVIQCQIATWQTFLRVLGQSKGTSRIRKILRKIDPALDPCPGAGHRATAQKGIYDWYERLYIVLRVLRDAYSRLPGRRVDSPRISQDVTKVLYAVDPAMGRRRQSQKKLQHLIGRLPAEYQQALSDIDLQLYIVSNTPSKFALDYLERRYKIPGRTIKNYIERQRREKYKDLSREAVRRQVRRARAETYCAVVESMGLQDLLLQPETVRKNKLLSPFIGEIEQLNFKQEEDTYPTETIILRDWKDLDCLKKHSDVGRYARTYVWHIRNTEPPPSSFVWRDKNKNGEIVKAVVIEVTEEAVKAIREKKEEK